MAVGDPMAPLGAVPPLRQLSRCSGRSRGDIRRQMIGQSRKIIEQAGKIRARID